MHWPIRSEETSYLAQGNLYHAVPQIGGSLRTSSHMSFSNVPLSMRAAHFALDNTMILSNKRQPTSQPESRVTQKRRPLRSARPSGWSSAIWQRRLRQLHL